MIVTLGNTKERPVVNAISLRRELELFMEDTGITKKKVAELLGFPSYKYVTNILEGKEEITLRCAIAIAHLIGISEQQLLDSAYKEIKGENGLNIDNIRYASFLYSNFDCRALKTLKLFESNDTDEQMCNRLVEYFGYHSIFEYKVPISPKSALFSKRKVSAQEKRDGLMMNFWLTTAQRSFMEMNNPNEYDRELLKDFVLKRIKQYTNDVNSGFSIAIYVLYQLGVSVLVQDYITGTHAYGVSFIINGKPCIVLTALGGHYYKLWITLLHELYHILNDWNYLQQIGCMISDESQGELFVSESDADRFACNCLIPQSLYGKLELIIDSKVKVNQLAQKLSIHPTIVYGIYLEQIQDKMKKKKAFEKHVYLKNILQTKDTKCLKKITYNPIEEGNIRTAVKRVKKALGIMVA
jgi:HTH-type transcriptional regulator/antitoxin HigA